MLFPDSDSDTADCNAELAELTTVSFSAADTPAPFVIRTDNQRDFTICNRGQCEIVQLKYDTSDEDLLKLQLSTCAVSTDRPTSQLLSRPVQQLKPTNPHGQLPDMLLDATMLPQLAPEPIDAVLIAQQFSDTSSSAETGELLLAALTNFGALHVYTKKRFDRRWSAIWADLSALWLRECGRELYKLRHLDAGRFAAKVHDVQIVAFGWQMGKAELGGRHSLVAVTGSGRAVFFAIAVCLGEETTAADESVAPNGRFELSVTIPKADEEVAHVRWQGERLCTADTMGNVRLYAVRTDSGSGAVSGLSHLCDCLQLNTAMRLNGLHLEVNCADSVAIVLVCMPSKLIICYAEPANSDATSYENPRPIVHDLRGQIITGCSHIGRRQYALCTANGVVQQLSLGPTASDGLIAVRTIRTAINAERYGLVGIAASPQHLLWLLVTYPRIPFDHLVLRQPLAVLVYSPSTEHVLRLLQQPLRVERRRPISDLHDAVEVFRYRQLRHSGLLGYEAPQLPALSAAEESTEAVLFALRLHLMVVQVLLQYYRRIYDHTKCEKMSDEIDFLQHTILTIIFYQQLSRLLADNWPGADCRSPLPASTKTTTSTTASATPRPWTPAQALTVRCMRTALRNYATGAQETAVPADCASHYDTLSAQLREMCLELAETGAAADEWAADNEQTEECDQCDATVEPVGSFQCTDGHRLVRCCISGQLVGFVSKHGCRQCQCVALESVDQLREAMRSDRGAVFLCPYCDVPLTR